MENKGQGALEYLLLIGGAVLVAVIVITLLLGITNTGGTTTSNTAAVALCKQKTVTDNSSIANGDLCSTGTITISSTDYTCGGTYPNCTATPA